MPAILVESGRAAVAKAINDQAIYLAWGTGDPGWDLQSNRPTEKSGAKELIAETGRRIVTSTSYCIPDTAGKIIVSTGRFTASTDPQKYLYLRFTYDFYDGKDDTIRELGVFVGGTTIEESASQNHNGYYLLSEVTDKGQLLVSQYIDTLTRSDSVKQQFEFVIQF